MTTVKAVSLKRRAGLNLALAVLAAALAPGTARAAFLRNYPLTLVQPDGEALSGFTTGDEWRHRVHDAAGYTILKNPDSGYYVYAVEQDGRVVPSDFRVGRWNPGALGIAPDLVPRTAASGKISQARFRGSPLNPPQIHRAPTFGSFDNIVVFIRFSDEEEFGESIAEYGSWFDLDEPGHNSLRNYFLEVSYGRLAIRSVFCPFPRKLQVVSFQDSHPRGYFQPYDSRTNPDGYQGDYEAAIREQTLLGDAVESLSGQISPALNIDGDNDGYVDNVCFIVKGDPDGWGDLLWPHMWSLYLSSASINNKRVYTFNLQLQNTLKRRGVGVLCHEMFHSLGSPDLYHYSDDGLNPVGQWDVMESNREPPQHMGAHMKHKYGQWIDSIPEITASGVYTLRPLTSPVQNCYKVKSPASATEYFVLEYRRKTGTFESSLPGQGLLVYRINSQLEGNASGPPDEVYIYRPDGTPDQDGRVNEAPFSLDVGRTVLNDSTNPCAFLTDGSLGHLDISEVGPAGDTISFRVTLSSPSPTSSGKARAKRN